MSGRSHRATHLIDGLALPVGLALLALLLAWHGQQLWGFATLGHHDFRILREATAEFWTGESLYAARTINGNLNPPHFHLLLIPFALPGPQAAFWAWTVVNIAGLALSIRLIVSELDIRLSAVGWVWATSASLLFAGTAAALWSGQTSLLLTWPATLAWRSARRESWRTSGALIGLLIALKPFMALFAPYFLLRRHVASVGAMVAVVIVCIGFGIVVFGVGEYQSWIQTLRSVNWADEPWNASLRAPMSRGFAIGTPGMNLVWLITATAVAIVSLVRALQPSSRPVDRAFASILTGALLASPLGWVHYLWWAAGPAAGTLLANVAGTLRGWRLAVLVIATVGLMSPPAVVGFWHSHVWGRVTFGSAYFWGTLALWTLVTWPAPAASPPSVPSAPSSWPSH